MTRNIAAIGLGIMLIAIGSGVSSQVYQPEPPGMSAPVQVIQPKIEILDRPVIIEVQVNPTLGADTSMWILCATSAYRGEVQEDRQNTTISLAISGEIKELSRERIFVSFDVQANSEDMNGGKGFSGSGAAILEAAKSKTVLTIGGRSVILTASFAPEEDAAGETAQE